MKAIFNTLFRPFRASMSDFDAWWTGFAISIPGFAGSLLSFLYFGAGLWAAVSVALRLFPLKFPLRSRLFVFSCIGYALALLFSSVLNDGIKGVGPGLTAGAAFYFVPFLVSRYRHSDPLRSFEVMVQYAPLGALLCLLPAVYQDVVLRHPVEGGAGNPSVFGFVAAVLGALSLANGHSGDKWARLLSYVGFLAGMSAIVFSGTRTLYPLIIIAPAIFLWMSAHVSRLTHVKIAGALLASTLVGVFIFRRRFSTEFVGTMGELSQVGGEAFMSSAGIRIELWKAAFASFWDSPWFGHGQIHKMDGINTRLPDFISYTRYNHAHNVWIDGLVSGGIIGATLMGLLIFSPLTMLLRKKSSNISFNFKYNYIIIIMTIIYIINGMLNAIFTHDVMASLFLIPLILVSSLDEIVKSQNE